MIGRGSCFWINLPRGEASPAITSATPDGDRQDALSGARILCVDNDPGVLDGLSLLLRGWGAQTRCAASIDSALAVCADPPDLAIIDYRLDDGVLGTEVLERLQQAWRQPVPAILITADRTNEVRQAAVGAGMVLLHKPVKPATLRGAIRQAGQLTQQAS